MSVLDIFRPRRPLHVAEVQRGFQWPFPGDLDTETGWYFGFVGGGGYTTTEDIESSFTGYINAAYKASGVVFACMAARMMIFSEARFRWQQLGGKEGHPGNLFDTPELEILHHPWPNGHTSELLARMIQDVDLAGNFYAVREGDRLRRLRPDWVTIILTAPPAVAVRSDVAGYRYSPGGGRVGADAEPEDEIFTIDEICHWSPIPDPDAQYRGMSWLTPVVREISADKAATLHKLKFFENGASPQVVVAPKVEMTADQFRAFIEAGNAASAGVNNAYKTMYVGGGSDVTVVGSDLRQLDFKATQGAGETRIAAAARIHPVIVGLSEGMQGSSLNAGNFSAARRIVADGTMRPLWRSACAAMEHVLEDPPGEPARLWYDDRDIAFLREDAKDAADIEQVRATTITQYVREGFTAESAIMAVHLQDVTLLKHTGLVSVQLQPPGTIAEPPGKAGDVDEEGDEGEPDEQTQALLDAFDAVTAGRSVGEWYIRRDADFESKHPRGPDGKFLSLVERLIGALKKHLDGDGDGDPFDGFDRKQLRAAAMKRGLDIPKGASRDEIAELLKADLKAHLPSGKATKTTKAVKKAVPNVAPAKKTLNVHDIFDAGAQELPGKPLAHAQANNGDTYLVKSDLPDLVVIEGTDADGNELFTEVVDKADFQDMAGPLDWYPMDVDVPAPAKKAAKEAAPAAKSTTIEPLTGKVTFQGIDHIPDDTKKLVFSGYKAQPSGQLMSSPSADSYDNLVAVAHVYGDKVPGGLSVEQAAQIVDEQLAKNQGLPDKHFLDKKIKEWLATGDGAAYAKGHTTPKKEIVDRLTGEVTLPKGVKLKPGEKVHKLSGPGKYNQSLSSSDFVKHTAHDMQQLQDKYHANTGTPFTAEQIAAMTNWSGGGYHGINNYLRGNSPGSPLVKQQTVQLQSAMHPLQEHALLLRGTGTDQLPEGFRDANSAKKLVGKTLQMNEFFATSVAGSGGHFTHQKVHWKIEAPKGTPGAFVKKYSVHPAENELVLAARSRYRVLSVTIDQFGNVIIRVRVVTRK